MCRRWDSNPHEVALTGFFESDKDCAMVRDAALRSAFMSLFTSFGGMWRVSVRPDYHQNSHQTILSITAFSSHAFYLRPDLYQTIVTSMVW